VAIPRDTKNMWHVYSRIYAYHVG